MTRDQLEAEFRTALTQAFNIARTEPLWRDQAAVTGLANTLVDGMLEAADKFAVFYGGLTAERRAILHQATPRKRRT